MKSRFCALFYSAVGFAAGHTIATQSPVEKVVKLLTDIKTRIETDGEAEQQLYDKFACWCDNTSKRKAAAIIQANDDIRAMGQQILSLKGRIATRTAEIAHLVAKLKDNAAEQERATVLRSKDNKAYMEESAEIKESIAALEQAVKALIAGTKQGGASLLQAQATGSAAVRQALQSLPDRVSLKPEQMSLLSEFATGVSSEKYAPQSATIQGMLADMYSTFATDLQESTMDEARQNTQFENLIATLEGEATELRSTKQKKEEELVDAETLLADTTQTYDDTEAQKAADIEFFDETKETCLTKAEEWNTRKEAREEELAGITEGLEILTSDDARELFAKAIKPGKETGADSFMQIRSDGNENAPLEHAYAALKTAATKAHSFRLAQLAVTVRTTKSGHFDAVIEAIDEIYQNLKDENNADIAKRDECKEKNQEITSTVADLDWKMSVNQANIDKLSKQIENREAEKTKTLEEIEDMATQIAGMEEQRKLDHESFLATKSDDEGALELLGAAKQAIAKFYQDKKKESLLQAGPDFEVSEDQAPSADFNGRESRKGEAKGVLSLMTMLIEDLEDEVKNGIKDEAKAHEEFEDMLKSAKKVKEDLITKTTNLEEIIAKRGEKKTEEHTTKGRNQDDKTSELEYKAEIKPDCDWILKNFHDRALQRGSEMDGLLTAKSMLQGAKPAAALIEQGFDDNAFSGIRFLGVK